MTRVVEQVLHLRCVGVFLRDIPCVTIDFEDTDALTQREIVYPIQVRLIGGQIRMVDTALITDRLAESLPKILGSFHLDRKHTI